MTQESFNNDLLARYKDIARVTQVIYQTLIQTTISNLPEGQKGIPAHEAELLHSLSSSVATLTVNSDVERDSAWQAILNTAMLARQFYPKVGVASSETVADIKTPV